MNPREKMIREITEKYKLNSPGVLFGLGKIPREKFVPLKYKHLAYEDGPLPIGFGQTISQPFTVAFMAHLLSLKGKEKVLEIGTGSGYSTALLSLLAGEVYSVERIRPLAIRAEKRLKKLGYKNVFVKFDQGEKGWKEESPFDAIIITAGVGKVPKELFRELKNGGILVAPSGEGIDKYMTKYTKVDSKIKEEKEGIYNFVPLITEKPLNNY